MNEVIQKFIELYTPGNNLIKPDQSLIEKAKPILPKEIIDLWINYGLGEYGNGLIRIVNPEEYMRPLYEWLGKEDYSRIPIMVDAFGDIFYYRALENGANDISVVDIHYGTIQVCAYSYTEFFNGFLTNTEANDIYLRRDLYNQAINKCGHLASNESFFFKPAINTAGYEHVDFIDKGNTLGSQEFLLKLKLNEINLVNKYSNYNSQMIINKVFPTSNGSTPVLGNIVKGSLSLGDQITIFNSAGNSFNGVIEKINASNGDVNTINQEDKVIIFLNNVTSEQIGEIDVLNRGILLK